MASNQVRLRLGVIGLGRLWEVRHKPALARMADRFRVTAVYDQVARRSEGEARDLGCDAATGLAALLAREDVDAIHLPTPQWFGLHAVSAALRSGRPVYCAYPLVGDASVVDEIGRLAAPGRDRPGLMPEYARRIYPATVRLRELFATRIGPPRLVVGQVRLAGFDRYGQPGPSTQIAPATLLVDPISYLIDWARYLFQAEPTSIRGFGGVAIPTGPGPGPGPEPDHDFESFSAEFPGGGMAQIAVTRYQRGPAGEAVRAGPNLGFSIVAERGSAWVEMPDRVVWTDPQGTHDERLPMGPSLGEALNAGFHRAALGADRSGPGIEDALAVARLVLRLKRGGPSDVAGPAR